MMNVVVAYASEHGSTRGIAERIAAGLRMAGIPAETRSMDGTAGFEHADAFVIGSAVHNGRWLEAANSFVETNQDLLLHRPVWMFSVSCVGARGGAFRHPVNRLLRRVRGEARQLRTYRDLIDFSDHRDFAGAVEPSHWPRSGRLIFRLMTGRFGDHRNWQEIEAWTASIADDLISALIRPLQPRYPQDSA